MKETLLYFLKNNPKPDYVVGKALIFAYLGFIFSLLLWVLETQWLVNTDFILFAYWESFNWYGFYWCLIILWVGCSLALPVMSFVYQRETEWKWMTGMASTVTLVYVVPPILFLMWVFRPDSAITVTPLTSWLSPDGRKKVTEYAYNKEHGSFRDAAGNNVYVLYQLGYFPKTIVVDGCRNRYLENNAHYPAGWKDNEHFQVNNRVIELDQSQAAWCQ